MDGSRRRQAELQNYMAEQVSLPLHRQCAQFADQEPVHPIGTTLSIDLGQIEKQRRRLARERGAAAEAAWSGELEESCFGELLVRLGRERQTGVLYVNRRAGATTGAWPGVQPFGGWKGSGSTGKAALGPYYVAQFLREQSHTIVD